MKKVLFLALLSLSSLTTLASRYATPEEIVEILNTDINEDRTLVENVLVADFFEDYEGEAPGTNLSIVSIDMDQNGNVSRVNLMSAEGNSSAACLNIKEATEENPEAFIELRFGNWSMRLLSEEG